MGEEENNIEQSYESELKPHEVERYSRQLLTGQHWTVANQISVQQAAVLIVGAGGIGSTVIPYLAGAGVGVLRVVDSDVVETSNLHRQGILHGGNIGASKAKSAAQAVAAMNPHVNVEAHDDRITPDTILNYLDDRIRCVVDCSDNPFTRYTLNDACYFQKVPLVSASAIGSSAQITVFDFSECCYRCLYPNHSGTAFQNCNDNGVWGPVPGLIGTAAAMECLKVIGRFGSPLYHHTLVYQADTAEAKRWRKPAKSRKECCLCGDAPTIQSLQDTKDDLAALLSCDVANADKDDLPHVSVREYKTIRESRRPHVLLDVRNVAQFQLVHLPNSTNVPLKDIVQSPSILGSLDADVPIFVICRRGIASAIALKHLKQILPENTRIHHIQGGLDSWRRDIDPLFPKY